eukprot:TRINITY_DN2981_c0_g1_i1.p1 TRINITY_DN2981_c0_g1~~TRINITY_DN2981_c0_g1_i1.p1  ORF type:complete len:648 (+),score=145.25 TRINITY_DN2981_c0_g1_i1:1464-3407(+)
MLARHLTRSITTRCLSYMDSWVWEPHSDGNGYFDELTRRPLRDEITGTEVHVLGMSEYSADSAKDVREHIRKMRNGPRGRKLDICVAMSSLEMLQTVEGCFGGAEEARHEKMERAANLGYPPDILAAEVLGFQEQGLLPYQGTIAAVVESSRLGIPLHFLGLKEDIPFIRCRHVTILANEFLQDGNPSLTDCLPSEFGLYADHHAHLHPTATTAVLESRPTPSLVMSKLSSLDLPTLYFRYVQPTAHLVQEVKRLVSSSEHNNGAVLVVLPAWIAPMFYKIYKDQGLTETDLSGIYYNFKELHEIETSDISSLDNTQDVAAALDNVTTALQDTASEGKLQAEFEVQLLLFLHLCKIRPDVLKYQQAAVNIYLVHGLVPEAIMFLRSAVDSHVPGAYNLLTTIVADLIDEGLASPDDPFIEMAIAPPPQPPADTTPLKLLPPPEGREMPTMVLHNETGVVAHSREQLPDFQNLDSGDMTEQRKAIVSRALVEYQENSLMRDEPSPHIQKQMERKKDAYQRMQFTVPEHHPFSEIAKTPGGDLPSHGVLPSLPTYITNSDFPVPHRTKTDLMEHTKAAAKAIARVDRRSAIDKLIKTSEKIRTRAPARSLEEAVLQGSRLHDKRAIERHKARLRNNKNWALAQSMFPDT